VDLGPPDPTIAGLCDEPATFVKALAAVRGVNDLHLGDVSWAFAL
jgi:hypothetical protein